MSGSASDRLGPITGARATAGNGLDRIRDWWAQAPGAIRWPVYLALVVIALVLPNQTIGNFMTPGSDWGSVLFYPVGTFILLAIGLHVVVGQAGLLDLC